MTVDELIELLQQQPGDEEVFIASDPEGNGFHPVDEVVLEPVVEVYGEEVDGGVVIWP